MPSGPIARWRCVILWSSVAVVCACQSDPEDRTSDPKTARDASSGESEEERPDELSDSLFEMLSQDFTARELTLQLSNDHGLLKRQVLEMDVRLRQLGRDVKQALESDPETSNRVRDDLDSLALRMTALEASLEKYERDIDAVFADHESIRREFRSMLDSLVVYRDAHRESLAVRRQALREEIELLDRLLGDEAEQRGAGEPEAGELEAVADQLESHEQAGDRGADE